MMHTIGIVSSGGTGHLCVRPGYSSPADYSGHGTYSAIGHSILSSCDFNVYEMSSNNSTGSIFVDVTNTIMDMVVHFYNTDGTFLGSENISEGQVYRKWSLGFSGVKVIVQPAIGGITGTYDIDIALIAI